MNIVKENFVELMSQQYTVEELEIDYLKPDEPFKNNDVNVFFTVFKSGWNSHEIYISKDEIKPNIVLESFLELAKNSMDEKTLVFDETDNENVFIDPFVQDLFMLFNYGWNSYTAYRDKKTS